MPARPLGASNTTVERYHLHDDFVDENRGDSQDPSLYPEYYPENVSGRLLTSRERPNWRTISEGPVYYEGELRHSHVTNKDGHIATASEQRLGEWSLNWRWESADTYGTPDSFEWQLIAPSAQYPTPQWVLQITSHGDIMLIRSDRDGNHRAVCQANFDDLETMQEISVRREPTNNWQLRLNGVIQDSTVDPFMPQSGVTTLCFECHGNSIATIDSLRIGSPL
jgi:hypothetical protein